MECGRTIIRCDPKFMHIAKLAGNRYSQYGEDGIVDAIFELVGYENRYCLEVGAADGIMFSNTRRLVEQGWRALLIESDPDLYGRLVKNTEAYPDVITINDLVSMEDGHRLDNFLAKHDAPTMPDLVSIDVDGQEFHLWNSMMLFRPRVLVVELLPTESPDIDSMFIPAIGGEGQAGQIPTRQMGASKGYEMVAWTFTNMIFVQYELQDKLLLKG